METKGQFTKRSTSELYKIWLNRNSTNFYIQLPQRQQPFPRDKKYICVNNFGYSGSNGHAVLTALPAEDEIEFLDAEKFEGHIRTKRLFVLSANDEAAARKSMEQLGIFLEQHAELYQSTMPRNLSCKF